MFHRFISAFCLSALCLCACFDASAPLDADTRQFIDSTANAQIRQSRIEIDSLCSIERRERMSFWVDSIRKRREQEIQEKLKNIPRN